MLRRAFTLIELLVVIAIMGMVLGAVAPALTRGDAADRDATVAAIESTLKRARATALREATQATVTIDPATARVWVRSSAIDTSFTIALPNGARLESRTARPRFTFAANGGARGEQLVVSSALARTVISLDPWTGDVRLASIGADAKP